MEDAHHSVTTIHAAREKVLVNGAPADAWITEQSEIRWLADGRESCLGLESEVLGFAADGAKLTVKAFTVMGTVTSSCRVVGGKRAMRDYVFRMVDLAAAAGWCQLLRSRFASFGRPKELFIFVNPFGGKRSARKIFETKVKPLLDAANILYTVQETNYQLHAKEIVHSLDLRKYDGIVCVSGDGVLVEVVNGLLQREDWNMAIKVPLGIIPAGTGNGMAKSLLHAAGEAYSVPDAVFAIIRGHKRSLDVSSVKQGDTKFYSILMLTWGVMADIDIESEKYRWMGSARIDFYAVLRILKLRKYSGSLQFVPAPGYEIFGEPMKCPESCESNGSNAVVGDQQNHLPTESTGYPGVQSDISGHEWRSLNGPFISVSLTNVPWVSEDAMPAPEAKFSDGYLDVVIIKDCPKSALVSLMSSLNDGSYVKSPHVIYLKVIAARLQPGLRVGSCTKGGIIDIDGEVIARGDTAACERVDKYLMAYGPPISITVDQGLATIFSPR